MVRAVRFASHIGNPINALITVNAAHLQRIGSDSIFEIGHLWDGFQEFLQLLRKWLKYRGSPWACVWSREYTGGRNNHHGEHWHIAIHLPPKHRTDLASQIAIWSGEGIGKPDGKKKCIAKSTGGAWYINKHYGNAGEYLGKATPPKRSRYGRQVTNQHRESFKYRGGEGPIEGKRYGISRTIGETAQERLGWAA